MPFVRDRQLQVVFAHLNDPSPKPTDVDPELPEAIDDVLATAMAKEPGERYATGAELATAASAAFPEHRRGSWPIAALIGLAAVLAAAAVATGILLTTGGEESGAAFAPVQVDSLVRIDPETDKATAAIVVDADPSAVAVGEGAVWVASKDTSRILRIDPEQGDVTGRFLGGTGSASGVAAGEGAVWATFDHFREDDLDGGEPLLLRLEPTASRSFAPVDTPAGGTTGFYGLTTGEGAVWLAAPVVSQTQIYRIDPETNEVTTISGDRVLDPNQAGRETPIFDTGVAVGEDAVWTINHHGLFRVDLAANELELLQDFSFRTKGIAAGEGAVWIVDTGTDSVLRFDPVEGRVTDTIKVGSDVTGIAVGGGSVWVGNGRDGTVSRIDPKGREVVATIDAGGHAKHIAVGEGSVWVTVRP